MKNKTLRFILIFILSGLALLVLTWPFHKLFEVFTVTEVRPSAVLYPILGISFGWPAALGMMTANFISDFLNGYSWTVLLEGIIPQILYAMIPYYMWNYLTRGEMHPHRLDSVGRVLKFTLICLVMAVISGVCVGFIVQTNFGADGGSAGFFVFLNNFIIAESLGLPAMILINRIIAAKRGYDRSLSVNEKIMLTGFLADIISLAILVPVMYSKGTVIGTYDVWNSIYFYGIIVVVAIMILSLIAMIAAERIKVRGN